MLWKITRAERRILDAWEVTGRWYDTSVLQFQEDSGDYTQIEVPMIKFAGKSVAVNGKYYRNFINPKNEMLKVAQHLRTMIPN